MARVLLFGPLRDLAGWRERDIDAPDVATLRALIANDDPALGQALAGKGVQVAVDQAITRPNDASAAALSPSTEVAFLPPMSGG